MNMGMAAGILSLVGTQFVRTRMAASIVDLYKMGSGVSQFLDDHFNKMQSSDNSTIAQTGRVMEGAKNGFGLGYISTIAIMATGQILLGNSLDTLGTLATGVTFTNPIAMTCAAFGAIYYGWNALSAEEKQTILKKLSDGLEIGVELIKSIIHFVISKTNEIFSDQNIAEFKIFIKEYASRFGKSLYEVTGKFSDLVKGTAEKVEVLSTKAGEFTSAAVDQAAMSVKEALVKTGDAVASASDVASEAVKNAFEKAGDTVNEIGNSAKEGIKKKIESTKNDPQDPK